MASFAWMASSPAQAIGITRTANATVLGQPLDFTATVRLDTDEVLTADCIQADVNLGDRMLPSLAVRVSVESGGNERRVRVRTTVPVDEPIVTVALRLGCPMQLSRSFVAFIDPPGIQLAQAAPPPALAPAGASTASGAVAGGSGGSSQPSDAAAPAVDSGASAPLASAAPRQASGTGTVAVRPRAERRPAPAVDTGERRAAAPRAAAPREAAGPRLRLDPVAPPTRQAAASAPAGLPATTAVAGAPAAPAEVVPPVAVAEAASAAASAALPDARASEDAAIKALEQSLATLRAEALATQRSVAALQARLAQAESERYANPVVYALVAAVLALAGALLFTLSRLRQANRARGWWQASVADDAPAAVAAAPALQSAAADSVSEQLAPLTVEPESRFPDGALSTQPAAASAYGAGLTTSLGFRSPDELRRTSGPIPLIPAAEARREVTVEELIDLEQQAEFFVVLGQDEAAIDVLMGHLRSTGGATPLPYLKLLEIYRRRDDRDAYERIRERFNRRFNAYAPEWGNDLTQGRSLEDYPAALSRVQSVWADPVAAMEVLEGSLLRQDEGVGTYELPAYREVLFLYSVARDIAERLQPESVDLLLPLVDSGHPMPGGGSASNPASGLSRGTGANRPSGASDGTETSSELDRRSRYDADFSFDSSGFISTNSKPGVPPRR